MHRPRWTRASWKPTDTILISWGLEAWFPNATVWRDGRFYFATRVLRVWWTRRRDVLGVAIRGGWGIDCPIWHLWRAWRKHRDSLYSRDVKLCRISGVLVARGIDRDKAVTLEVKDAGQAFVDLVVRQHPEPK